MSWCLTIAVHGLGLAEKCSLDTNWQQAGNIETGKKKHALSLLDKLIPVVRLVPSRICCCLFLLDATGSDLVTFTSDNHSCNFFGLSETDGVVVSWYWRCSFCLDVVLVCGSRWKRMPS